MAALSHCDLISHSRAERVFVRAGLLSADGNALSFVWFFRLERPILGEHPKAHKSASSGRLPSSVTEG